LVGFVGLVGFVSSSLLLKSGSSFGLIGTSGSADSGTTLPGSDSSGTTFPGYGSSGTILPGNSFSSFFVFSYLLVPYPPLLVVSS